MIAIKNLVFMALFAISATGCAASSGDGGLPGPATTLRAKIDYVIDGDTLLVTAGERPVRVRLLGVDAPEDTRRRECFGGQATAGLRRLLPTGSTVLLAVQRRRDPYDRDLAFVWRADGMFVNLTLVRRGYATTLFLSPGDRHRPLLVGAEDMARDTRSGLWRACASRAPRPPSPAGRGSWRETRSYEVSGNATIRPYLPRGPTRFA